MKPQSNFIIQFKKVWYLLNAYASSKYLKRRDSRMLMKAWAKKLGTVHESLVQVTYANSEGPGERAYSCIIGYLKQQGDQSSKRHFVAGRLWVVLCAC